MKATYIFATVLFVSSVVKAAEVFRSGTDYVVFDEKSGAYEIHYLCEDDGKAHIVSFVPPTNFHVTAFTKFRDLGQGVIEYRYVVTNEQVSKQSVDTMWVPSRTSSIVHSSPAGWDFFESIGVTTELEIGWQKLCEQPGECLQPNQTQKGFLFSTRSLPLIGDAAFSAWDELLVFCGEGPNADVAYYLEENVLNIVKQRVHARVVMPGIPIDSLAPKTMVDTLATHIDYLKRKGELREPVADRLMGEVQAASGLIGENKLDLASVRLKEARQVVNIENTGNSGRSMSQDVVEVLRFDLSYIEKMLTSVR